MTTAKSDKTKPMGQGVSDIDLSIKQMISRLYNHYLYCLENDIDPSSHMIWGPPGVGKTHGVYTFTRMISDKIKKPVNVITCLTSTYDPVDIAGVPFVEKDCVVYKPFDWMWKATEEADDTNPLILFLDDIPAGHPQVQAACFKLVHEKMAAGKKFRKNVMIVAAGNRVEDNAGANDMPTALANRFRHIHIKLNVTEWIEHAKNARFHPLVIAYISANNQSLHNFDPSSSEKEFASPRSMEEVSKFLYELEFTGAPMRNLYKDLRGMIGKGLGVELDGFIENSTAMVPPEEIIAKGEKARLPSKTNLDAWWTTFTSLERHVLDDPLNRWEPAIKYTIKPEVIETKADLGLTLVDAVLRAIDAIPAQRMRIFGEAAKLIRPTSYFEYVKMIRNFDSEKGKI